MIIYQLFAIIILYLQISLIFNFLISTNTIILCFNINVEINAFGYHIERKILHKA